jgi:hypothetical protein
MTIHESGFWVSFRIDGQLYIFKKSMQRCFSHFKYERRCNRETVVVLKNL